MSALAVDTAMPAAYLADRPRPRAVGPGHQRIGGEVVHVSNTAEYGHGTRVQVVRDGWEFGTVKGAIVWALYRAAVAFGQNLGADLGEYAHLLSDVELHPFTPATLTVNGIAYPGLELSGFGVAVRAATVEGWTVLLCTPAVHDAAVRLNLRA